MAVPFLDPQDLEAFANIDEAKAEQMIADVEAMAHMAAPCLKDEEFQSDASYFGAVKAIIRQAVLRRNDSGTGAVTQVGAGPFQQSTDTRGPARGLLWPSEIAQLRDLCSQYRGDTQDRAYTVSMIPEGTAKPTLRDRPDLWFQWADPETGEV